MSIIYSFPLAILFQLLFFIHLSHSRCEESFECSSLGTLKFPFSSTHGCAPIFSNCSVSPPEIIFDQTLMAYEVVKTYSSNKFVLLSIVTNEYLEKNSCDALRPLYLPQSLPSISLSINYPQNTTILYCNKNLPQSDLEIISNYFQGVFQIYKDDCPADIYYTMLPLVSPNSPIPTTCKQIEMPTKANPTSDNIFELLSAEFDVEFHVSRDCAACHHQRGICFSNGNHEFECRGSKTNKTTIIVIIVGAALTIAVSVFLLCRWRILRIPGRAVAVPFVELEMMSSSRFGSGRTISNVPVFSYDELEEATGHFDPSRELGSGAFGAVYYGRLRDGREVAVKRLRDHSSRLVDSFDNEVRVLSQLRHPNLVVLYGCTARTSQGLLLVYEYISNGTVADQLRGPRAQVSPLTWLIRLRIAIETASAISYLHQSNIIHRDIKTENMLLDQDQHVKVGDFGLARAIPGNASHVSTSPHGTHGYIDPEYYQVYQLTTKSDVYSFGVVLVEFISSQLPVDVTRQRGEVNLADFALARIRNSDWNAIFDPALGHATDVRVEWMLTSVGDLAFQCLQRQPEQRPSMEEVAYALQDIEAQGNQPLP